ncbi:MAG: Ku protein [Saprospiraceae bacterium]|nr:Ku protein [Saprospiraceae bacterium]
MRSIWKGHIRFSLVTIPIQVFSAVETSNAISFKQLHNDDHGRVRYKKVCSTCDEEIPYRDIVKGYEYEPDKYVILNKEELNAIKLKSNRAIEIESFVDVEEVHPSRFEAVYFIGPNGDIAKEPYNLFKAALLKTQKAGVGRIILRDREDVVLITAQEKGLILYKLRYPYELRSMDDIPDLSEREVDLSQLQLAETLIASLNKPFSKIDFEDRYRDALLEIVEDKISGKEIVTLSETIDEAPVVDIMEALKKSIEAAKRAKRV